MYFGFPATLSLLLYLFPFAHTADHANCAHPSTQEPPKLYDCKQVISDIERRMVETGNPLFTASRRGSSNIHLPNLFWDHLPGSSCAVRLDMVTGREKGTDELRLSDIAYTAQKIMDECLSPKPAPRATGGWMIAGRHGFVNITVERLHWDFKGSGRFTGSGRWRGKVVPLRLPKGTAQRNGSDVE